MLRRAILLLYIKSDSMVVSHFETRPVKGEVVHVLLRGNADHVLILDTVMGVLPIAIDAVTGPIYDNAPP